MSLKTLKKSFYFLFVLDILAGVFVAFVVYPLAGIITSLVLLILNITSYRVLSKIYQNSRGINGSK